MISYSSIELQVVSFTQLQEEVITRSSIHQRNQWKMMLLVNHWFRDQTTMQKHWRRECLRIMIRQHQWSDTIKRSESGLVLMQVLSLVMYGRVSLVSLSPSLNLLPSWANLDSNERFVSFKWIQFLEYGQKDVSKDHGSSKAGVWLVALMLDWTRYSVHGTIQSQTFISHSGSPHCKDCKLQVNTDVYRNNLNKQDTLDHSNCWTEDSVKHLHMTDKRFVWEVVTSGLSDIKEIARQDLTRSPIVADCQCISMQLAFVPISLYSFQPRSSGFKSNVRTLHVLLCPNSACFQPDEEVHHENMGTVRHQYCWVRLSISKEFIYPHYSSTAMTLKKDETSTKSSAENHQKVL